MKDNFLIYDSLPNQNIKPIVKAIIKKKEPQDNEIAITKEMQLQIDTLKIYKDEIFFSIEIGIENKEMYNEITFSNILNDLFHKKASYNSNGTYKWFVLEIFPNEKNSSNFLYINDVLSYTVVNRKNNFTYFNLICIPEYSYMYVGSLKKEPETISEYIEINELNKEEIEYIDKLEKTDNRIGIKKYVENKTPFFSFKKKKKNEKNTFDFDVQDLNMTEQEKQIFDPKILVAHYGAPNSKTELESLIGLSNVKKEIEKLKAKLSYRKFQEKRGIYIEDAENLHMCFTGAPGTGKTTVARAITGILYDLGYIKENKFIEVNGQSLKGGYSGQTAIITKLILKSAKNKVLFIDEAYSIFDDYENGFGKEAVAVILKYLEDERDNTVIIFAGYKNEMNQFLNMNEGLRSRINRYIDFENYTTKEMVDILLMMLQQRKLFITKDALLKCMSDFKIESKTDNFSNARYVRNYVEKLEFEHAFNLPLLGEECEDTITLRDVNSNNSKTF